MSTVSGIQSTPTGDRVVPASTRPDGSTRKPIRIRPGFHPVEDIQRYRVDPAAGAAARARRAVKVVAAAKEKEETVMETQRGGSDELVEAMGKITVGDKVENKEGCGEKEKERVLGRVERVESWRREGPVELRAGWRTGKQEDRPGRSDERRPRNDGAKFDRWERRGHRGHNGAKEVMEEKPWQRGTWERKENPVIPENKEIYQRPLEHRERERRQSTVEKIQTHGHGHGHGHSGSFSGRIMTSWRRDINASMPPPMTLLSLPSPGLTVLSPTTPKKTSPFGDAKPKDIVDPVIKETLEEQRVAAEAEREKKGRALRKKLKQARELEERKGKGEVLLAEQKEKVQRIGEVLKELESLGFKE